MCFDRVVHNHSILPTMIYLYLALSPIFRATGEVSPPNVWHVQGVRTAIAAGILAAWTCRVSAVEDEVELCSWILSKIRPQQRREIKIMSHRKNQESLGTIWDKLSTSQPAWAGTVDRLNQLAARPRGSLTREAWGWVADLADGGEYRAAND
ncbi:hypothetical protein C8R44DRAFT_726566 [Mycena epipterygia]|nr:hypothetical protein C8R44DRAFT_726566 [Mycena epipterygia]